MRSRFTTQELTEEAESAGLGVQHDCGGYRLVKIGIYVFPSGGVCPTATKRECMIFLAGVKHGQKTTSTKKSSKP